MVGGASKGLGYAVARALASEGARLSIASRDRDAVQRAADALSREAGSDVLPVAADLSKADAIDRWHAETRDDDRGSRRAQSLLEPGR